jgi:chemotaxis protein CheD
VLVGPSSLIVHNGLQEKEMQSHYSLKLPRFNPAALPSDYLPSISGVSDEKHAKHYLIPGKVFASSGPFAITTIVGSGVTLCLCDPTTGIGGANHFLMPVGADVTNEVLLKKVLELGANLHCLEGKIFGGSQPLVTFGNSAEWIGNRNVDSAMHFLSTRGIRLTEKEVGGTRGRKMIFHTDNGHAWSQQL